MSALDRIEADGRSGIWIEVIDADEALAAAAAVDRRRAGGGAPAARRHDARGEGQHRRRRPSDHGRVPQLRRGRGPQRAVRSRRWRPRARSSSGSRTSTSSRPGSSAPGRPTAPAPTPAGPNSCRAARARAPRSRSRPGSSTSRSVPTPRGRAGCPPRANGIVGLKPTRGRWSTLGIVPACRSLDCVVGLRPVPSAGGGGGAGPLGSAARARPTSWRRSGEQASMPAGTIRVGVPTAGSLTFAGDARGSRRFSEAVDDADRVAPVGRLVRGSRRHRPRPVRRGRSVVVRRRVRGRAVRGGRMRSWHGARPTSIPTSAAVIERAGRRLAPGRSSATGPSCADSTGSPRRRGIGST